jgi:PAS domain S-box-containing protein
VRRWVRSPGRNLPGHTDAKLGPRWTWRLRFVPLFVRPAALSFRTGATVAAAFLVIETVVVCALNVGTHSTGRFGTLYLLGVLVVSTISGFGLSVATSVASAIAFAYFRSWPAHSMVWEPQTALVIAVFLGVALLANAVAGLARAGERFFDLSSDLLCISSADNVIRVNPAFERTLGYATRDLRSKPYLDIVHPEDRAHVREALAGLSGTDEFARYDIRLRCRDGSLRWLEWSVVWRRGLFYSVGRDVTERRRERDELRRAQATVEASRDELAVLAEQQAALRRVAILVARGCDPPEVFAAVADELAGWLHTGNATVTRFDDDGTLVILALGRLDPALTNIPLIGQRIPMEGDNLAVRVLRSCRPARMDSHENAPGPVSAQIRAMGLHGTVGAPIVVNGRVWGMAAVGSATPEPPPPGTELRVADFADLAATAVANAATRTELQASRDSLSVLATQQSALRRVATLVARGVAPSEVFSAVAEEMARCLKVDNAEVFRYEPDGTAAIVASYAGPSEPHLSVGERVTLEGRNVPATVLQTGRPARMDSYGGATGSLALRLRAMGVSCRVGAPIVVDERVWGAAVVGSSQPQPLPDDTEERIAEFAELVATAIAAATTRADLIASRARIVAASDDARRRLERDLHDGAQQRLVSLALELRVAEASVPDADHALKEQLSGIVAGLNGVSEDLQDLSRGIHPAILSQGGLGPALKTLARRSSLPVSLDLGIEGPRLPVFAEVAAYFVVAEALTNAAKHAHATGVTISAEASNSDLRLLISDDGIGGADSANGSGLIGLKDRVEALGGSLELSSPTGSGTSLRVTIPLIARGAAG